MDAKEFVTAISQIIPNKQDILKSTTFSESFIDMYIRELCIRKKTAHVDMSSFGPIFDLIFNYDLSDFRILEYRFNAEDDITENEQFIYVGWREAFPFAILKETGEVVETDWGSSDYIVSYIAKDQSSFLEVLVEREKLSQGEIFYSMTEKEKSDMLKHIQTIAGGEKYSPNYE